MCDLRQHTLLRIVVALRGASDNTLYWVLLWVMRGFGQHTLLGIIRSDVARAFINGFKIILFLNKLLVEKSNRFPYLLRSGYPLITKIHGTAFLFPNQPLLLFPK
jgi:hypothetical protein